MFFSIIVPVYNVDKYIRCCLDSIRKQTFKDFEVVIVDDGSTDESPSICDEFANLDERFKVIHKKNEGVVSARKKGAEQIVGEYLVTVDGDDEIEENFLLDIYNIIMSKHPDLVAFGYKTINEEGDVVSERLNDICNGYYAGANLKELKSNFLYDENRSGINGGNLIFSTWSKVIKASIYHECIMKVDDRVEKGDDLIALIYIMQMVESAILADITGYHYRIQPTSISRVYKIDDLRKQAILKNEIYKAISSDNSMKKQALVCVFYTSYSRFRGLFGAETSYKEYKKIVNESEKYHLFDCIHEMHCSHMSFAEKMKFQMIKNGWWKLFYAYVKLQSFFS